MFYNRGSIIKQGYSMADIKPERIQEMKSQNEFRNIASIRKKICREFGISPESSTLTEQEFYDISDAIKQSSFSRKRKKVMRLLQSQIISIKALTPPLSQREREFF
ncbi:MAG: hypothetical protein WCL30_01710 [Pseudomonadota bacterium]